MVNVTEARTAIFVTRSPMAIAMTPPNDDNGERKTDDHVNDHDKVGEP